eukprot:1208749-Rhodomonas_salina.1
MDVFDVPAAMRDREGAASGAARMNPFSVHTVRQLSTAHRIAPCATSVPHSACRTIQHPCFPVPLPMLSGTTRLVPDAPLSTTDGIVVLRSGGGDAPAALGASGGGAGSALGSLTRGGSDCLQVCVRERE